eukprot:gnl/Trimastix_PCT/4618.p1 GENE.gnl/Trimastix_PCT/4618~~gnl/Trimastix_PCT/4618.p1  ORF type:complete len:427 (-),score=25.91 gnl/Trimastix_PCT/4618:87-1367(-)
MATEHIRRFIYQYILNELIDETLPPIIRESVRGVALTYVNKRQQRHPNGTPPPLPKLTPASVSPMQTPYRSPPSMNRRNLNSDYLPSCDATATHRRPSSTHSEGNLDPTSTSVLSMKKPSPSRRKPPKGAQLAFVHEEERSQGRERPGSSEDDLEMDINVIRQQNAKKQGKRHSRTHIQPNKHQSESMQDVSSHAQMPVSHQLSPPKPSHRRHLSPPVTRLFPRVSTSPSALSSPAPAKSFDIGDGSPALPGLSPSLARTQGTRHIAPAHTSAYTPTHHTPTQTPPHILTIPNHTPPIFTATQSQTQTQTQPHTHAHTHPYPYGLERRAVRGTADGMPSQEVLSLFAQFLIEEVVADQTHQAAREVLKESLGAAFFQRAFLRSVCVAFAREDSRVPLDLRDRLFSRALLRGLLPVYIKAMRDDAKP